MTYIRPRGGREGHPVKLANYVVIIDYLPTYIAGPSVQERRERYINEYCIESERPGGGSRSS